MSDKSFIDNFAQINEGETIFKKNKNEDGIDLYLKCLEDAYTSLDINLLDIFIDHHLNRIKTTYANRRSGIDKHMAVLHGPVTGLILYYTHFTCDYDKLLICVERMFDKIYTFYPDVFRTGCPCGFKSDYSTFRDYVRYEVSIFNWIFLAENKHFKKIITTQFKFFHDVMYCIVLKMKKLYEYNPMVFGNNSHDQLKYSCIYSCCDIIINIYENALKEYESHNNIYCVYMMKQNTKLFDPHLIREISKYNLLKIRSVRDGYTNSLLFQ